MVNKKYKRNFDEFLAFKKEYGAATFSVGLRGEKKGKYPWEMLKEIERLQKQVK